MLRTYFLLVNLRVILIYLILHYVYAGKCLFLVHCCDTFGKHCITSLQEITIMSGLPCNTSE